MNRKVIAGFEVALGAVGIASIAWPLSRFCSGWPLGHNCEAWFILGVNILAPIGAVALVCAAWSLKSPSRAPHIVLGATVVAVIGRFALSALLT